MGFFEMVYDGHGGLPAVAYRLKDEDQGFTLYDLSDRVRMGGWQIASYSLSMNCKDTVVQRILIRHGVSRDLAQLLLDDIKRAVEHLENNPVPNSAAKPGFHHD
jgi:glutamate decarboxylase